MVNTWLHWIVVILTLASCMLVGLITDRLVDPNYAPAVGATYGAIVGWFFLRPLFRRRAKLLRRMYRIYLDGLIRRDVL